MNPSLDNENKGVSLVLINSDKGIRVFEKIKNKIVFFESNMIECKQPNLVKPTTPSPNRDEFERIFLSRGYFAAIQSFPQLKIKSKLRIFLEKIVNKIKKVYI